MEQGEKKIEEKLNTVLYMNQIGWFVRLFTKCARSFGFSD
jgi:hypothetical protein